MRTLFTSLALALVSAAPIYAWEEPHFSSHWDTPAAGFITYVERPVAETPLPAKAPSAVQQTWFERVASPDNAAVKPTCEDEVVARGIYFQADGLYFGRIGTGCDQVLVIDANSASGSDPLYRTRDLDFGGAGGMRFLVGWTPDPCRCSRCCAWELSYWGIINWQAHARVTGSGNLAVPGDLGLASNNFFLADIIDINYRSSLHNVELNCIKTCSLCDATIDFLAGFRVMTLQERFTITGTDFQEGTSSYDITANNWLYGVQLGGRHTRHYCGWSLQLFGNAGVFLNDASQSQIITDFPNTGGGPFVLRSNIRADDTTVAALGELGVTAIRPINDVWSLRLGYMALGLGGVALGPDQLDFTDTFRSGDVLNANGWIFAHGAMLGAEASW